MTNLRVLVLSDLHCTSKPPGDAAGSWLTTTTSTDPRINPLRAVDRVLHDAGVTVDIILCAGDLCDKADPAALQYVWHELTSLADRLEARLIATVGNHDLDSRHAAGVDPKEALFGLEPIFPCLNDTLRDRYWSRDYALVEGEGWRIVTLNSCTFHGYNPADGPELETGRVSRNSCRLLREELNALVPTTAIQILLVHHHLEQLPDVDQQDRSQMKDGSYSA
jgi:predicted MPP superfamily phosphohydrolase